MPFHDGDLFFKIGLLNPKFYCGLGGGALFGPSCQKQEILDPPKSKILTDN